MKKPEVISENENYKAIDIGALEQICDYEFTHPNLKHIVQGKLFIGEFIKSTGAEISFQELPPKTTIPFLHKHKKHEEIYIFLKGKGKYQVDNDIFNIKEGSIVRVSPKGSRIFRNDSDTTMIYMVIQCHVDSLTGYNISDGYRIDGEIKLKID